MSKERPEVVTLISAFVELTFGSGGKYPLKFTTAVRVLPDTLPFAAPVPKRPSSAAGIR